MAGESVTAIDYVEHHLQSLTSLSDVIQGQGLKNTANFSFINMGTLFLSILLGVVSSFLLWRGAKKATAGVPGHFQATVEILLESADDMYKSIVYNERSHRAAAPLGLTLFVWIFLMNAMGIFLVDLLPWTWQHLTGNHHALLRTVLAADLDTTLALAIGVLGIYIYYNIKIKGFGGWMHELFNAPFGAKLAPANFLSNLAEFLSKTVSRGMRLFGNTYADELVFLLIVLLDGAQAASGGAGAMDPILFVLHLIAGLTWVILRILVITLQTFIFMALAFVYIGQARDTR